MYHVDIKESLHEWEKTNLVTKSTRGKSFDEVVCKNCQMKGRRYNLGQVSISETYSKDKVFLCPKATLREVAKKVRVTFCSAHGKIFGNLTPGSEHEVVTPPGDYKNDHTGVWVMGIGEPVKLLSNEFVEL